MGGHVDWRRSAASQGHSSDRSGLLKRFADDTRGAAAVVFALAFSAILFGAALALDYARGTAELTREQWALDAAALAAAEHLGTEDQDTAGPAAAHAFFEANLRPGSTGQLTSVKLDGDAGAVTARAEGTVISSLLRAFGHRELKVGADTRVVKGNTTLEVALVLDNSGSMGGTYIEELKTAAQTLSNVLFSGAEGTEKIRIGVVPFAGSVNIGAHFRGEAFIDNDGQSPVHYENFASSRTRFQLYDDMSVSWNGCVEVRPGAHAYSDTAATADVPETLFVPMFAPDEPDSDNDGGQSFSNSYLVDDGGACSPQPTYCSRYDRKGECKRWSKVAIETAAAQARICKYAGQSPSSSSGPNQNCQTKPILALSSDHLAVESAISGMVASGFTNIGEGLMWGWRILSPGLPFSEGRAYGTSGNQKFIVLMTDGENTYQAQSNMNKSHYNAYGFGAKDRLGTTYNSTAYRTTMDANLTAACSNARAQGITIYTIAFRLEDSPATQSLLAACASDNKHAFTASDGTALKLVFQTIATQLSKLRVAG